MLVYVVYIYVVIVVYYILDLYGILYDLVIKFVFVCIYISLEIVIVGLIED